LSEIRRRLSGLDPVPRKIKRMVTDVVTGRERAFDAEHIRVGRKKVLRIRVGGSVAKLLAALREMDAKQ
jgi:hypothetical protein